MDTTRNSLANLAKTLRAEKANSLSIREKNRAIRANMRAFRHTLETLESYKEPETREYTYTDTFGGEPNFCWAQRVEAKDIRHAKKSLGLNGVRFRYVGCGRWDEIGAHCCIISESGER